MFEKLFKKKEELPELPDISELEVPEPLPMPNIPDITPKKEQKKEAVKATKEKQKKEIRIKEKKETITKPTVRPERKEPKQKENIFLADLMKKIERMVDERCGSLTRQLVEMKKVKSGKDADEMMLQMFDTLKRLGDEFVAERRLRDAQYKEFNKKISAEIRTMSGALSGVKKEASKPSDFEKDVRGVTDQLVAELAYKDEQISELKLRLEGMKQEIEALSDLRSGEKVEESIKKKITILSEELKSVRSLVVSRDYKAEEAAFEERLKHEFEEFRKSVPELEKIELFTVRQDLIEDKLDKMKSKVDRMNVAKMNAIVSRLGKIVSEMGKKKAAAKKKK